MATLGLGRTYHIYTRKRVWLKSVLPKGGRLTFAGMATLGLERTHHIDTQKRVWLKSVLPLWPQREGAPKGRPGILFNQTRFRVI